MSNNEEILSCYDKGKLLRMRDQADELMMLAYQDGDGKDAKRWNQKREAINQRLKELT